MREQQVRTDERQAEERDDDSSDEPTAPAWFAICRATALFVGCLTLLNLLAEMRFPNFSAAAWWIDLAPLPKAASRGVLGLSGALLIAFALFPRANGFVRRLGGLCTLGLLGAVGWTIYRYYRRDHAGQSFHDLPIPFALHVAALLVVVLPGQLTGWWERTNFFKDFFIGTITLATCVVSFPLAGFVCLGQIDDRVQADAAVVVAGRSDAETGSRSDDKSTPLAQACQLYRDGQVKKLVLLGRADESGTETAELLKHACLAAGIPEADLLTPPAPSASADPRAALAEAAKYLGEQKLSHVLVVARFFEAPRVRLSLQRAGLEVHSVPVREDIRPAAMRPVLMREAAALWMCYLHPVTM
jgi:uncharacterized SAM-binding protein YcdF (DUF218 family)